ncbi:hypothetical protein SFUMM280S_00994 [Streptomyces fumanus]
MDADDLAFGTSRWSSKLIHGGLRYLASARFGVAHESAVERGVLMERTAPHLVAAQPFALLLTPLVARGQAAVAWTGLRAGDALRLGARTARATLPAPRRLTAVETRRLARRCAPTGCAAACCPGTAGFTDDARLVTALARTAACDRSLASSSGVRDRAGLRPPGRSPPGGQLEARRRARGRAARLLVTSSLTTRRAVSRGSSRALSTPGLPGAGRANAWTEVAGGGDHPRSRRESPPPSDSTEESTASGSARRSHYRGGRTVRSRRADLGQAGGLRHSHDYRHRRRGPSRSPLAVNFRRVGTVSLPRGSGVIPGRGGLPPPESLGHVHTPATI